MSNVNALRDRLIGSRRGVLTPPVRMSPAEWADTYRRMSSKESSTPGRFEVARVEVCRGPVESAVEDGVREITLMSATQLMKTTVLENLFGYFAHLDPGPILIVQPSQEMADAFVKSKLEPMILNTPALVRAFGGKRAIASKSRTNTMKRKDFRGGAVDIVTAGSAKNFSLRAARFLLLDEVDKYPETEEGDGISLGVERLETFSHNSLIVQVCSPTITGKSKIEKKYEASDQRRAYVPCPHCGHEDWLKWENVKFADRDQPGLERWETAGYMCAECGVIWSEQERIRALTTKGGIFWRQTRPFVCCGDEKQDPQVERKWDEAGRALCRECGRRAVPNHHAGFHASFLYSTRKNINLDVKKFLESKGDRSALRVFVNTRLAQTFEDDKQLEAVELDTDVLKKRAEPRWTTLPAGAVVLTAGVDTQDDRLECEVVAWGHGDESWSVGYHRIEIPPSDDEAWRELDKILMTGHEREDGAMLYVQAASVDSAGHFTQSVYAYCAARARRRVIPIKGAPDSNGMRSSVFPNTKVVPAGKPYTVGTNAAKDRLESMMRVQTPGPGYMHIPGDRADDWFKGMTSEKREIDFYKGRRLTRWVPKYKGIRNEPIDCRVYAYTALEMLRRFKVISPRSLMPVGAALPEGSAASAAATPAPAPAPAKPQRKPRPGGGGFGGSGRFGGGGGFGLGRRGR